MELGPSAVRLAACRIRSLAGDLHPTLLAALFEAKLRKWSSALSPAKPRCSQVCSHRQACRLRVVE